MANPNDPRYVKLVQEFSDDPEFIGFSDEDQDSILDTAFQKRYGEIPKTENLLQRAINVVKPIGEFSEGFADTQTFGLNRLGGFGGRKLADMLVPGENPPSFYDQPDQTLSRGIGQAVPIGQMAGSLGKLGIKALFGKQFANAQLPKATGRLTESIQKVISRSKANPQKLSASNKEVSKFIEDQFSKAHNPRGREASVFNSWKKVLKNKPEELTADVLEQMETEFGKASAFSNKPSNPTLAQGAKEVRKFISDKMDDIAKRAKVPEFVTRSTKKSKLLTASKSKPSFAGKLAKGAIEYGVKGGAGYGGYRIIKSMFD